MRGAEIAGRGDDKSLLTSVILVSRHFSKFLFAVALIVFAIVAYVLFRLGPVALLICVSVIGYLFRKIGALGVMLFSRPKLAPAVGDRTTAPQIVALLDEISLQLGIPRVSRVAIVDDLNAYASISRDEKMGLTVGIGLTLIWALNVEQVKVILAHEMAHHLYEHTRESIFVAEMSSEYWRLRRTIPSDHFPLGTIYEAWYKFAYRYCRARLAAVSRSNEYQADRFSATMTSPTIAAAAQCRLEIVKAWLQVRVYDPLAFELRSNRMTVTPPHDKVRELLANPIPREFALEAVTRLEAPSPFDSHPRLDERVAALGQEVTLEIVPNSSMGAELLPIEQQTKLVHLMKEDWRSNYLR